MDDACKKGMDFAQLRDVCQREIDRFINDGGVFLSPAGDNKALGRDDVFCYHKKLITQARKRVSYSSTKKALTKKASTKQANATDTEEKLTIEEKLAIEENLAGNQTTEDLTAAAQSLISLSSLQHVENHNQQKVGQETAVNVFDNQNNEKGKANGTPSTSALIEERPKRKREPPKRFAEEKALYSLHSGKRKKHQVKCDESLLVPKVKCVKSPIDSINSIEGFESDSKHDHLFQKKFASKKVIVKKPPKYKDTTTQKKIQAVKVARKGNILHPRKTKAKRWKDTSIQDYMFKVYKFECREHYSEYLKKKNTSLGMHPPSQENQRTIRMQQRSVATRNT